MDYTVLARRFRPQAFGEVVGQETVAQALRNAISGGRVAHAYLFTGARGVGKTSMARILAKSLNCLNAIDGNPCNQCDVCRSISAGNDVDVIEIDGASNRGIEDIRSLRANVNVKSMRSHYKIYIIDEVHMLTREAFNALLKTLEEPPPNVKFIFCTTEAQKLPDTILSRCQRFDFTTIATAAIIERLRQIAEAEGIPVEPAALELVARKAAGSMRDSQSLFDQLLAFGGKSLTADDVQRLLGIASDDRLTELADALIQRRRDAVLESLNAALNAGVQLGELVDQLLSYFRDLMVLAAGTKDVALLSVSEDRRKTLAQQASAWGLQTCLAALQILAEARGRMKGVSYGRAIAELALVRISLLEDLDDLAGIIQQLKAGRIPVLTQVATPAPASPAPRATPPSGAQEAPPGRGVEAGPAARAAEAQKKNEPEPAAAVAPGGSLGAERVDIVNPTLALEAGHEAEILSQLISGLPDMTKSHAKNITRLAISGPNHVVLAFPKSYHLSKQYLERPDQLGRLEKALGGIVGKAVRASLATDESTATSALPGTPIANLRPEPPAAAAGGPRRSAVEQDAFVQKVISVFGARVNP